jgi:glycerol-3-phosphate dehydrogenase (NAD(P)+)
LNIGIIGAGSWGTAVGNILADNKFQVVIWGRDTSVVNHINEYNENCKYLKGFPLNPLLKADKNIEKVISNSDIIINAIPTQSIREVMSPFGKILKNKIIVNTAKGIEKETLKLIDEIFYDITGYSGNIAFLSGPTFAEEVLSRLPTATTISSLDKKLSGELQKIFNNSYFRVYTETDVKGVLLGGAVKNIIAIGAGMLESIKLGNNARASLITRGLAEIIRLGVKMGAHPQTFSGLTGLGDLILTCTGNLSRNRKVGMELGKGLKLEKIINSLGMVAEGIDTCHSVYALANKFNVEMPITTEVYNIIYANKSPIKAVNDLMKRKLKEEKC